MSAPTPPDPTALDKGRDDKALADAFKVLAGAVEKLAAKPAPGGGAPAPAPPSGSSAPAAQVRFARAALAAALTGLPQVLAKAVANLGSGAGAQAARAGAAVVNRGVTTVADMGQMLAARFVATLGPLAVFAQTLQASNSGMSVLGKSVQVLAATLAPIILPVAVALAAALVELSDNLEGELKPAITEWTRLIISTTPALLEFARALAQTIGWLANTSAKTSEATKVANEGEASKAILAGKSREQFAQEVDQFREIRYLRTIGMGETAEGRKAAYINAYDELKRSTTPARTNGPAKPRTAAEINANNAITAGKTREQFEQWLNAAADQTKLVGERRDAALKANLDAFDRLKNPAAGAAKPAGAASPATVGAAPGDSDTIGGGATRAVRAAGGVTVAPGAPPRAGEPAKPAAAGAAPRLPPRSALDDVMASLRMSIMPQASIGSLEGVGRQVQLKALQSDPLDARLLDITTKSVDRLDSIIGELKGLRGDMTTPAKKGPGGPTFTTDGSKPGAK